MTDQPADQQPRDVVFLDCETSGLDPRVHVAWDVAAWNLTTGHRVQFFAAIPDMSRFLGTADPKALRVNRFLDRYPLDGPCPGKAETTRGLSDLLDVLDGGRGTLLADEDPPPAPIIIGSKPTFDMDFVGNLAATYDYPDTAWHHHPLDIGSYCAGVLGIAVGTQSLSAGSVARLCRVAPGDHSAEGDVTSGGRSYLLLREAARRARDGGGPAAEFLARTPLVDPPEMIEAELLRSPLIVTA